MASFTSMSDLWNYLKNLRININVKKDFKGQVQQVDDLLENDKTGIVSTIYDFMIHSATVPMKIETKNESLNSYLQTWQKEILNKDVNIDIPGGLRALSVENYKERWRSSLLALKVTWGEEDFGGANGKWIVPKKMWFLNGSAIETEDNGSLISRKFYLNKGKKDKEQLSNGVNTSIFIRKPFTSWHKNNVVPYLVQRGTLFNALMKSAIVQKQSDVIEAILPLILQLKAGNDQLAMAGMNPTKEQFDELKNKIVDAKERFDDSGNLGDLIASLRHDVNLDYLIPDLNKILGDNIVKSTDRNLLSSLGLIELQGFSSNRQEAILNPKVLIEEVTDAVKDWACLLEEVMIEMLKRNKARHNSLTKGNIRVIPGKIKTFLTDEMKALLRSMYDRGVISKETGVEDIADADFEVEVERREKEDKRGLQKTMKPPVIQNLEQYTDPQLDDTNLEDQDKKPGTPEADNFNNAVLKAFSKTKRNNTLVKCQGCNFIFDYVSIPEKRMGSVECPNCKKEILQDGRVCPKEEKKEAVIAEKEIVMAPYQNIDELPSNVKNVLPIPAQVLWLRVFNAILKETGDEDRARKGAWAKVKEQYEPGKNTDNWVKKASIEDYRDKMSIATFKFFEEIYNNILEQSNSTTNALTSALAIIEKISTKNDKGVLVKDKTITKAQLQALDNAEVVDEILNLQLKEKKLELIDKLLHSEE